MKKFLQVVVSVLILSAFPAVALAVVVTVKTGVEFKRPLLKIAADHIVIRDENGFERKILYKDIKKMSGDEFLQVKEDDPKRQAMVQSFIQRDKYKKNVTALLWQKNFDELEKIAHQARTSLDRFPSGYWKINQFYYGVHKSYEDPPSLKEQEEVVAILEEWAQQKPDSITPRIALMEAYKDLAWLHRGTGYANTVSYMGGINFERYLRKSNTLAEEIHQGEVKDPELYRTWIFTALGLGLGKEKLYEIVEAGVKLNKDYYPLYIRMGPAILPRWGGSTGEVEQFAEWAAESAGEEMYARVAYEIFDYGGKNTFDKFDFDWERIKKGFSEIQEKYPANLHYRNLFARMACHHQDAAAAQLMFEEIGQLWTFQMLDVWSSVADFYKWKQWAASSVDQGGGKSLHYLVLRDDLKAIQQSIDAGADLDKEDIDGYTPLMIALKNYKPDVAELLIASGADMAKDREGVLPVHWAAYYGVDSALAHLLSKGVYVNARDDEMRTPLHYAVNAEELGTVLFLFGWDGIDINTQDKWKQTPLHRAIHGENYDIVGALLSQSRINVNLADQWGRTPLNLAEEMDQQVIAQRLKDMGAKRGEKAISKEDREEADALYRKGYELIRKNQFKEAKKYYMQAAQKNPSLDNVYYSIASIEFRHRNLQEAMKYARKEIEIDPDDAYSHYIIGRCVFELGGSKEEYMKHFRRYTELDPDSYETKDLHKRYPELKKKR